MFASCRHPEKKLPVLSKFEFRGQDTVYKKIPFFVSLPGTACRLIVENFTGRYI